MKNTISWVAAAVLLFSFFLSPSFAKSLDNVESKYDASYFRAIAGEVRGQTAPGIKSLVINGARIPVDRRWNFAAKVSLAEGQKYLVIESFYKNLRFTKKYLVVRHPGAPKKFKIVVPKSDFQKIVQKAPPLIRKARKFIARKTKARKMAAPVKAIAPKPAPSYAFVAEIEPGKMLIIRKIAGKYFAAISIPQEGLWISLQKISLQEFKDLLEKGALPSSFNP